MKAATLLVAKKFGLKVGAPVFIPFMGAFIALKEAPRNAWIEACVGIGGPMLGSLGALVCNVLGEMFAAPIFIALAWFGYFLNLFNLTPVGMLDGGRIVTALSRWLWLPGFALLRLVRMEVSEFCYLVDCPACRCRGSIRYFANERRKNSVTSKSHRRSAG